MLWEKKRKIVIKFEIPSTEWCFFLRKTVKKCVSRQVWYHVDMQKVHFSIFFYNLNIKPRPACSRPCPLQAQIWDVFFWWFVTFFSLFLLESSRYSRKHIFSFFSKTLFCLLTAWFDHDFFGSKTTFCWICTPEIKKIFFWEKRSGKLWWHKSLSFSRFFNVFSKIVIVLWFWSYLPLTTAL